MNKKQATAAAERWNGESEEPPREPAEEYDITIIVEADGATMTVKLPGIKREALMAPGRDVIKIAVQNFEHFVFGQPLPPKDAAPDPIMLPDITARESAGTVNKEGPDFGKPLKSAE